MSRYIDIENRDHFEQIILDAEVPVVVDFWAPGCSPCRAMDEDFLAASLQFKDEVQFIRVNVHDNQELAQVMGIRSVPTLVVFRGHKVFDIRAGRTSRKGILRMAQRVLDKEQGVGLVGKIRRLLSQ